MLKLFILRHGKAVKPDILVNDFNRKLNKKGTAQVNQIGYILQNTNQMIPEIISSGAKRTEETAEIMRYYLEAPTIQFEDNLYLASRKKIQAYLQNNATEKTVLLVGHNFGLSDFANYLTGTELLLSTAMLVQINFNFDDWKMLSGSTGTIAQIIEPKVHTF